MSTSIDQSFIKQYESEVKEAYQRQGSLLRNFVRRAQKVQGQDVTFQKIGAGTASTKTRHGDVPTMNISHTPVTCTLADYYAGDFVDRLDLLKTNIDERNATTRAGAMALGRKTDSLIIAALDTATNNTSTNLSAITASVMAGLITTLGARDVPVADDEMCVAVSWAVWGKLLSLQEFVNSQWVGPDELPLKSKVQAKRWAGGIWFPHSGLSGTSGARKCYAFHYASIGHGIGEEVVTDITWQGTKAAWFINNMMSQGSVLIDDNGVQRWTINEGA